MLSTETLLVASSSLRSDTEPEEELDAALFPETRCASSLHESCDGDVENEPLSGLVEHNGTTRGTKLSVLQRILFPFWDQSWLLTADPLKGSGLCKAYPAVGHTFPRGCALPH